MVDGGNTGKQPMTGGASGSGGGGVRPHPGDVPGSTLASSMEAAVAMIDCGLGLGGGVALLVSDGARRVGGLDVPRLRRALAIAVVLLEDGRTERVERVGGRILVCFY
jgi:hypothetical protein